MAAALVRERMCEEEIEHHFQALKRLARLNANLAHSQVSHLIRLDRLALHNGDGVVSWRALGSAQDK